MSRDVSRALRATLGVMWVAVLAAGCGSDAVAPLAFEQIEDVTFHESLGVDLSLMTVTSSGLYYQDIVVGEGALAGPGDEVGVHYRVRMRTGTQLDASDGITPWVFRINVSNVYLGFNEGIRGMRVGGQRKLILPPQLADNIRGPEGILVFDVELVEIRDDVN